jgi:hypothetical protein
MLNQQNILDAATATQVIYSASSVAERIIGPFLVAERICSVALPSMSRPFF